MKNEAALNLIKRKLRIAWKKATSSDPAGWTPENPAWGQCAVTACVVQDALGGDIVWAEATTPKGAKISHYFNRLADGSVVDLTRGQFPAGTFLDPAAGREKTQGRDGSAFETTRDYVLSFPATRQRYEALKATMSRIEICD